MLTAAGLHGVEEGELGSIGNWAESCGQFAPGSPNGLLKEPGWVSALALPIPATIAMAAAAKAAAHKERRFVFTKRNLSAAGRSGQAREFAGYEFSWFLRLQMPSTYARLDG